MAEFKVRGKEMLSKPVSKSGTGAVVYVPKAWLGRNVIIILEGE